MPRLSPSLVLSLAALSTAPLMLLADSMSPYNVQRRLENYTNQIIDSCRAGANDNNRSRSATPNVWNRTVKTPQQVRQEAEENSRYWAQRREQEDRMARDSQRAAAERAEEDRIRLEQYVQKEMARLQQADWNAYRARVGGYASRSPRPSFNTPSIALDWMLRHNQEAPNQWAQINAALLLIDGIGVPRDPAAAERLLEPGSRPAGEALHPYKRILLAYLKAAPGMSGSASAQTRAALADLRVLANSEPFARWFLARLLSASSSPSERLEALQHLPEGHDKAGFEMAMLTNASDDSCRRFLRRTLDEVLTRCVAELPAAIENWQARQLTQMAGFLPELKLDNRIQILDTYVDTVVRRCVSLAPERYLDYSLLDSLLNEAAKAGSPASCGLAVLARFHLVNLSEPSTDKSGWRGSERKREALEALEKWAKGSDVVASRARQALVQWAEETESSEVKWTPAPLPECLAWKQAADVSLERRNADFGKGLSQDSKETLEAIEAEKAARLAAIEAVGKRDARPPSDEATALALRSIRAEAGQWKAFAAVRSFHAAGESNGDPGFKVADPSFDLQKAKELYERACAEGLPLTERRTLFIEATRMGDAFAPGALAQLLNTPEINKSLRALSEARQVRDEQAGSGRIFVARLLSARIKNGNTPRPLLEQALSRGSALARRFQLDQHVGVQMARVADRPPSWQLKASLVAELDGLVRESNGDPNALGELSLLHSIATERERQTVSGWFAYIEQWEKDQSQREQDRGLAETLQPAVRGLADTLALWPGINHSDTRYRTMLREAVAARDEAEQLMSTDAPGSLALLVQAAAKGERGSLSRIAHHLRLGTGALPYAPQLAQLLESVELHMLEADTAAGDPQAALKLSEAHEKGLGTPQDPAAAQHWLQVAADLGNSYAASRLSGDEGGTLPPLSTRLRGKAQWQAITRSELLHGAPRSPAVDTLSLAGVKPKLEQVLVQAARKATQPDAKLLGLLTDTNLQSDNEAMEAALLKDPLAALVTQAQNAQSDAEYFWVAYLLSSGNYGLSRELEFAKRFHAVALDLLKLRAELGDKYAAYRLGLYRLNLYPLGQGLEADAKEGLRWVSYAAQLGLAEAARLMMEIHQEGIPGVQVSQEQARFWQGLLVEIDDGSLLPAQPLRSTGPRAPIALLRPSLEAALATAKASLNAVTVEDSNELSNRRTDAMNNEDRTAALKALAANAAAGHSASAFDVAALLATGEGWLEWDQTLAQQFHECALALREAEAERGDAASATCVGRGLLYRRNTPADLTRAIAWLSYGAELGSTAAVEELVKLYSKGAPGQAPDPQKAFQWLSFGERLGTEGFKPRRSLRNEDPPRSL